jgi:voltage-gated sodium channel
MKTIFQNEKLIFLLIIINILVIYFHSFDFFEPYFYIFDIVDIALTLFFSIEIIYSIFIVHKRFSVYFKNNWNKLDFIAIILSLPSVLIFFDSNFEMLTGFIALRTLRIFKTLRIIEFIPGGKKISKKIFGAFKGVAFILFTFVVFTTVISLVSVGLFKQVAPDYFQNAFDSFYTIFKIFSGDGFSDVVSQIQANSNTATTVFAKLYFVLIVFSGSILGLSLINSVFINEMTTIVDEVDENNDKSIDELKLQITQLNNKQDVIMDKLNKLMEEKDNSSN